MCMAAVPQFCYITLTLGLGTQWDWDGMGQSPFEVFSHWGVDIHLSTDKGDLDATLNP